MSIKTTGLTLAGGSSYYRIENKDGSFCSFYQKEYKDTPLEAAMKLDRMLTRAVTFGRMDRLYEDFFLANRDTLFTMRENLEKKKPDPDSYLYIVDKNLNITVHYLKSEPDSYENEVAIFSGKLGNFIENNIGARSVVGYRKALPYEARLVDGVIFINKNILKEKSK
jgi:hypothetical protein